MKKIILLLFTVSIVFGYFAFNHTGLDLVSGKEEESQPAEVSQVPETSCKYRVFIDTPLNPETEGTVLNKLYNYHQKNQTEINNISKKFIENNFPQISNANLLGFRTYNIDKDIFETRALKEILTLEAIEINNLSYKEFMLRITCGHAKALRNEVASSGGNQSFNQYKELVNTISGYNQIEELDINTNYQLSNLFMLEDVYFPDFYRQINEISSIDN